MAKNPQLVQTSSINLSDLQAAKREWSQRLLQAPRASGLRAMSMAAGAAPSQNVVGVGIGEKLVDNKPAGVMAVKFLVQVKYPEGQVGTKHQLPKTIGGLPVDVEQVGLFRRFATKAQTALATPPNPQQKFRPAQPGCSVGFRDPQDQFVMAGTFGAVVQKKQDLFVLSNNHVLADENQLPLGAPIFQPGLLDGGNANTDQIAALTRAIKLRSGNFNKVDAAIAKVTQKSLVSNSILFIGPPQGTSTAQIDMVVHKFGRTTSYRAGRVTSIDTDVTVQYETGNFSFANQIIIVGLNSQPFSAAGDSGSLILERSSQKAVGLLFAGSSSHTIANHIRDVLRALRVKLA
jgi:hypothetical protein